MDENNTTNIKKKKTSNIDLHLEEKLYKKFHQKAIKHCGDNRYADTDYIRYLISDAINHTKRPYREKALIMVNIQEMFNSFIADESRPEVIDKMNLLKEEALKLWDI